MKTTALLNSQSWSKNAVPKLAPYPSATKSFNKRSNNTATFSQHFSSSGSLTDFNKTFPSPSPSAFIKPNFRPLERDAQSRDPPSSSVNSSAPGSTTNSFPYLRTSFIGKEDKIAAFKSAAIAAS